MGKIEDYIKQRDAVIDGERPFKAGDWLKIKSSGIFVKLCRIEPDIKIIPVFASDDIGTGQGMPIIVDSMAELKEMCEIYHKLEREK